MSAAATLAAKIHQDAQFFDSMLHLVPTAYYAPPEQDTNNKFTHSKSSAANARQSIKENSKGGLKAKAKFDPKNYTSVLTSSKSKASNDDDDDDDDDDEDMEDDDDEEDDEDEDMEEAPKKVAPSKKAASNGAAHSKPTGAASSASTSVLLAGAPLSSLLPVPSLSSISADVGMDQLRQRLHERINGLSNKRKPEDHPFAKKRGKKDATKEKEKKKREKNEAKPSSHKAPAKKHAREEAAATEEPTAKKQKATTTTSNGGDVDHDRVRASDLLDSNDFQFASLKTLVHPQAKTGSFSLQGKQQRRKGKSDETLLKEVESFETKVKDLKASGDSAAAAALEQDRSMNNALLRAAGVKVKDDAKLLKKSLKRDEKKKDKSRAEWAERTAAAKTTQDAFHKERIERASKKGKGDRSRAGSTAGSEENAKPEKKGRSGPHSGKGEAPSSSSSSSSKKPAGRAGFEGKGGKKFLN